MVKAGTAQETAIAALDKSDGKVEQAVALLKTS